MKNSASNGKAHQKIDGKQLAHSLGEAASAAADNVGKTAVSVAGKTKELASKSQEAVYGALDQNGDGEGQHRGCHFDGGSGCRGFVSTGRSSFARNCKANARPK